MIKTHSNSGETNHSVYLRKGIIFNANNVELYTENRHKYQSVFREIMYVCENFVGGGQSQKAPLK